MSVWWGWGVCAVCTIVTPSCDRVVLVLLASVGLKSAGHVRSFLKSASRLSYMLKIGCGG
jgi:hypothetical protein